MIIRIYYITISVWKCNRHNLRHFSQGAYCHRLILQHVNQHPLVRPITSTRVLSTKELRRVQLGSSSQTIPPIITPVRHLEISLPDLLPQLFHWTNKSNTNVMSFNGTENKDGGKNQKWREKNLCPKISNFLMYFLFFHVFWHFKEQSQSSWSIVLWYSHRVL